MKRTSYLFRVVSVLCPLIAYSQSTMEFQSGTNIEVGSGADICANTVVISGTYSGGGTQCLSALPVEMVSMTAVATGSDVSLNWTTATETNNFGFDIERSPILAGNQPEWSKVGFVKGNGTSNAPKEYSFVDNTIKSGTYAYRLKQIDRDGKFDYSQSVEISVSALPNEFALMWNYPNPFNPSTMITYSLPERSIVRLTIINNLGQIVSEIVNETKEPGYYEQSFNASNLSSGVYFYRVEATSLKNPTQSFVETKKMVLMK